MVSPNPTPEPREAVRALIAERIHASDCGCKDFRFDGTDADDAYYRRHADAVMELFPSITAERVADLGGDGEFHRVPGECEATHRRYVLRTSPEPTRAPSVRPDTATAEPSGTPQRCGKCGGPLVPCTTCAEPSQCGAAFCVEHEPDDAPDHPEPQEGRTDG